MVPVLFFIVDNPKIRLQKYLSETGVCSRRAGEQMILEGKIFVNGVRVTELGTKVTPDVDRVLVEGQAVKARRKTYLALYKPRNVVCTRSDPQGRPTVMDFIPPEMSHVYPVGRLDYDSEGLILLTSDGEFCNRITHPSKGIDKIYYVEVKGAVSKETISQMLKGVHHQGDFLKASAVDVLRTNNTRTCMAITLREGKNREIRRILDCLQLIVLVLRREQVGPVKLDKMALGKWRLLTKTEIQLLLGI
jgi:23S rRNA pseudouridine2605 synthase